MARLLILSLEWGICIFQLSRWNNNYNIMKFNFSFIYVFCNVSHSIVKAFCDVSILKCWCHFHALPSSTHYCQHQFKHFLFSFTFNSIEFSVKCGLGGETVDLISLVKDLMWLSHFLKKKILIFAEFKWNFLKNAKKNVNLVPGCKEKDQNKLQTPNLINTFVKIKKFRKSA